jgi:hypothetical protein
MSNVAEGPSLRKSNWQIAQPIGAHKQQAIYGKTATKSRSSLESRKSRGVFCSLPQHF